MVSVDPRVASTAQRTLAAARAHRPPGADEQHCVGSDEGTAQEVFSVFLRLGLTSFGGPIAHLGYYRRDIVLKRRWLSEQAYADLVALCQVLPGPTSSQTGFAIGMMRAGLWGGPAAWLGFTLPSALLMIGFASLAPHLSSPVAERCLHGLKLVGVPIVCQAVIGMARTLTPDLRRRAVAATACLIVLVTRVPSMQLASIFLGGLAGVLLLRNGVSETRDQRGWTPSRGLGVACMVLFAMLLVGLPLSAALSGSSQLALASIFYRAGALVFGGGHVVLPLLQASLVPHWIGDAPFLAGYGAAQALPGPLFAFAGYVGASVERVSGIPGALIALVSIFLPGLLLVTGSLPLQSAVLESRQAQRALAGVNAAVVGILAAALYDPLWTTSVRSISDVGLVVAGLAALLRWRCPPFMLVVAFAGVSALLPVIVP